MKYSQLDRRITIEQPTITQDAAGQPVPTWSTLVTVWAEKDARLGNEQVQADQVTSQNLVNWRIRYRTGITNKMRISYDGNYYGIESKIEEGRKEYLFLKTTLRDNVGEF